jgi:hypothetical protein
VKTRSAASAPSWIGAILGRWGRVDRQAEVDLIGRDLASRPSPAKRRSLAPLVIAALVCAFCLVALRTDIVRMRYALGKELSHERALLETQRKLTIEAEHLRNAARIGERARELGFARPERIIDLPAVPEPSSGGSAPALAQAGVRP